MNHREILKLIETVDPSDTEKLDEIDFQVYLFLNSINHGIKQYTRSRDALKAIRPDGYYLGGLYFRSNSGDFYASIYKPVAKFVSDGWYVSEELPTEELAELHAIIQAIAYERSQVNG